MGEKNMVDFCLCCAQIIEPNGLDETGTFGHCNTCEKEQKLKEIEGFVSKKLLLIPKQREVKSLQYQSYLDGRLSILEEIKIILEG